MRLIDIARRFDGAGTGHLNAASRTIDAYVDEGILYDLAPDKTDLIPCQIIGFRAAAGVSMTVSILLDGHNLYSEVPFHMIYMDDKKPEECLSLDQLVPMNSPLSNSIQLTFNAAARDKVDELGHRYFGTIQWDGQDALAAHIAAQSNGQLSLISEDKPSGAPSSAEASSIDTMPDAVRTISAGQYVGYHITGFHVEKDQPLKAVISSHEGATENIYVPVDSLYNDPQTECDARLSQDELLFKLNTGDVADYTYYEQLGQDICQCYFKDTKEYRPGTYLGTIDYYNGGDFIAHLIKLENNQVALLPSHKIFFDMKPEDIPEDIPRYGKLSSGFVVDEPAPKN